MKIPNIFEYDNYFDFLRDIYELTKKDESNFSYEVFARRVGLSKTLIYDAISTNKRISFKKYYNFIEGFKLGELETEYFLSLYLKESSRSDVSNYFDKRIQNRFNPIVNINEVVKYKDDRPIFILIIAILRILDQLPSAEEMCFKLSHIESITKEEVQDYYNFLIQNKLVIIDEDEKLLVKPESSFSFGNDINKVANFFGTFDKYSNSFLKSLSTKKNESLKPYCFDSLFVNLTKEEAKELSDEFLFLRNRLCSKKKDLGTLDKKTYQVDLRLFPVLF